MDKKKVCFDCNHKFSESKGKMLIIESDNKLVWNFYCLSCLEAWRRRGLKNHGYSDNEIEDLLKREYPKRNTQKLNK